ncbi:MAG: GtrA family protein [Coriobacteriales bacterium]|jgi:putative flippase GtrA
MNFRGLYEEYKDIIPYAVFGVLTTLINIFSYWLFSHIFNFGVMPSTIAAWFLAVLFAYVTNRKWVFHSKVNGRVAIAKEMVQFFFFRLVTGVFDWAFMFVTVELLAWPDVWMKFFANVIVIILNYIFSKYFVFKHGFHRVGKSSDGGEKPIPGIASGDDGASNIEDPLAEKIDQ